MKLDLKRLARTGASSGAMVLALANSAAWAQQAEPQDDAANSGIAEIIVTAQRSETKLQDTPLSIVAVELSECDPSSLPCSCNWS